MSVAERREREREERRNLILDAASDVFCAKGLAFATMDDVAAQAQLGKGTLYLYFKSREELLMGMLARLQCRLLEQFEQIGASKSDGMSKVRQLLTIYAQFMNEPPHPFTVAVSRWISGTPFDDELTGNAAVQENRARLFAILYRSISEGQQDGSIRDGIDPGPTAVNLWTSLNGRLLFRLQQACLPLENPLSAFAGTLEDGIDFILDAIRPAEPELSS